MKWKVLFFFIEFLSVFLICTIFLERWNFCMFTWNNTTLSYAPDDFLAFCDLKPCLWPFFFSIYFFFMCHWHSFHKFQMKPVSYMESLHYRSILAFWNESETLFLTLSVEPDVKFLYYFHFAGLALYKLCEVSQITLL